MSIQKIANHKPFLKHPLMKPKPRYIPLLFGSLSGTLGFGDFQTDIIMYF